MAIKMLKLLSVSFLLLALGCEGKESKGVEEGSKTTTDSRASKDSVRIKTAKGDIVFKLLPEAAPNTVARFKELVSQGFYNGTVFHRVIPGFVIQGGDPKGTGTGGSGTKLKAEFSELKHKKGTVAMARAQDINSADSQFYIALGKQPHLDGKYTIFGDVTEGIEVLDKIKKGDKMLSVSLE